MLSPAAAWCGWDVALALVRIPPRYIPYGSKHCLRRYLTLGHHLVSAGKGNPGSHSGFDFSIFALVEPFCPVFDFSKSIENSNFRSPNC